jgi:hypothetical protein
MLLAKLLSDEPSDLSIHVMPGAGIQVTESP